MLDPSRGPAPAGYSELGESMKTHTALAGLVGLMALAGDARVEAWQGRSVAATMTAPGLTVEADAPLAEAAAQMEEHQVHRLVVVEPDGGRPIGILSTMDLVRALAAG